MRRSLISWRTRREPGSSTGTPLTGISKRRLAVGASGNHRAAAWYAADYCAGRWPLVSDTLRFRRRYRRACHSDNGSCEDICLVLKQTLMAGRPDAPLRRTLVGNDLAK